MSSSSDGGAIPGWPDARSSSSLSSCRASPLFDRQPRTPPAAVRAVRADSRTSDDPVRAAGPRQDATRHQTGSAVMFLPPVWFLGLEEVLIGRTDAIFVSLARTGLAALAFSIAGACLVHACGLFLRTLRLGADAGAPGSAGRAMSTLIDRLAGVLSADGRVRASFVFTARTLTRSPRHRLYLAGSLGVGLRSQASCARPPVSGSAARAEPEVNGLAARLNWCSFWCLARIAATIRRISRRAGSSGSSRRRLASGIAGRGAGSYWPCFPYSCCWRPCMSGSGAVSPPFISPWHSQRSAAGDRLHGLRRDAVRVGVHTAPGPSPRLYLFDYFLFAYMTPGLSSS